ncbi:SGNH/GDSL hydrolase family protein [Stakelama saccharophila]|uniref:SGNH/GDSL hydrolase family protein n=1 Tax=Stakelama saccharophila TaxID=3075605 RepID=A0ABZ0B611_9SPHN|nr:SGNH/GDSL hydrolase family protein [Stakelama sp. W311]WNO52835.1 SGNH/GDSL hydrolase family protein [Stakelama sp. W311]
MAFRHHIIRSGLALATAALAATPAAAQTKVPGDPYAGDPSGIVANPCPEHEPPKDGQGWQMWNLHMLTRDFGQLCRYRDANAELARSGKPVRVVFMGDSITDNWINLAPHLFEEGRIDRGISGQTTPQMLVRFRQDVIDLHPEAVHIMAGTNDIAGNTGAETIETLKGHIRSMAELAQAHGIAVILASIPPAGEFPWAKDKRPVPVIRAMNDWLRRYAAENGFTYVDYFSAMATPDGAMKDGLSSDGVHPTARGYAVMRPLTLAAIDEALGE